jgi:hypothetical protein
MGWGMGGGRQGGRNERRKAGRQGGREAGRQGGSGTTTLGQVKSRAGQRFLPTFHCDDVMMSSSSASLTTERFH